MEPLPLHEVVEQLATETRAQRNEMNATVGVDVPEARVKGDREQLERAGLRLTAVSCGGFSGAKS